MKLAKFVILPAALFTLLVLWAFWLEPASLRNETHKVQILSWPAECNGIRIAVLADLHTGSPFNGISKLEKIVLLTLSAKPDLVLLIGDYVIHGVRGGHFIPPEASARLLGRLAAPMGVYAVLGNHDWWFDAPRVRTALESVGITVLEDASILAEHGNCRFWLGGDQRLLRRRARSQEGPRRPAQVRSCYRLYSQPRHFSTDSVLDRTDYSRSYARGAGLHPIGGASNSSIAVWSKICRRSYRRGRTASVRQFGVGHQYPARTISRTS